eukprot:16657-Rhodomonas_salina.4
MIATNQTEHSCGKEGYAQTKPFSPRKSKSNRDERTRRLLTSLSSVSTKLRKIRYGTGGSDKERKIRVWDKRGTPAPRGLARGGGKGDKA